MRRKTEVFSAETGTGASTVASRNKVFAGLHLQQPLMVRMDITYGTTITIQLQGRRAGASWEVMAEKTYTSVSPQYIHAVWEVHVRYTQYRLNITVNTGCTVDKAYIGVGEKET